jgi:hypothetical protein
MIEKSLLDLGVFTVEREREEREREREREVLTVEKRSQA